MPNKNTPASLSSTTSPAESTTETSSATNPTVDPLQWQTPDPTTASSNPGSGPAGSAGSVPDWTASSEPQPEPPSNESGSSRESSPGNVSARKQLEQVIGTVLDTVTTFANQYATDEIGKDLGLWLADDQDRDGIAHPGAKILGRTGVMDGAGSEAADIIGLVIAVGGYAAKQIKRLTTVRHLRRLSAQATPPGGEPVTDAAAVS